MTYRCVTCGVEGDIPWYPPGVRLWTCTACAERFGSRQDALLASPPPGPEHQGRDLHCALCDARAPEHPAPGWGDVEEKPEDFDGPAEHLFLCPNCR